MRLGTAIMTIHRRNMLKRSLLLAVGIPALRTSILAGSEKKKIDADPVTTFDPHLYLFADDHWIAESTGLERIINRAQPLDEPVVWPDDPWTEADAAWGNVIRESDGRFRMFYNTALMGHSGPAWVLSKAIGHGGRPHDVGGHEMARAGVWGRGSDYALHPRSIHDVPLEQISLGKYAESTDGMRWTKPSLGLIEFRGSRKNNILLDGQRASRQTNGALTNVDGFTIVRDDNESDPDRRYKMIAHWESIHVWDNHELSGSLGRPESDIQKFREARGQYLTFSPDGLRWEHPLVRLEFPNGGGDRMLVVRDYRHARWMANTRAGGHQHPAFSHSANLVDWSTPEIIKSITPETVNAPTVESMIAFNYGNQNLAFPCGMDKPRGVFLPYLAARQEGRPWEMIDDQTPFILPGQPSAYNVGGAMPLHNEPFIVGDQLLFYFNAFSRYQDPPCPFGTRSIGVATLRRDGFVGRKVAAGAQQGNLITRPIQVGTEHLYVNVEMADKGGRLSVGLLDRQGNPIPGYELGQSVPIKADGVRQRVTWRKHRDLRSLADREVQAVLRIQGGAVLYALAFA